MIEEFVRYQDPTEADEPLRALPEVARLLAEFRYGL